MDNWEIGSCVTKWQHTKQRTTRDSIPYKSIANGTFESTKDVKARRSKRSDANECHTFHRFPISYSEYVQLGRTGILNVDIPVVSD